MSPTIIGVIGIIVLVIAFLSEMPIAFCMAFVGLIGIIYLKSPGVAFTILSRDFWTVFSTYTLSCVPMFVLMGTIAAESGISKDLYATGYAFVGQFRGGLALATTVGCALFAAISGSSAAEAAAMAKIALPEMRKYNYDSALATGSIAAAGTLAIMIPPSMGFIIYGFLTQQSVGRLFIAGIIPGIILTMFFMVTVYTICRFNPGLGPAGPSVTWKARLKSLAGCIDMILLFLLVIGGLFAGLFTPTEGGAAGAAGALIISLARRRIDWRKFVDSLRGTALVTGMIFVLIGGAYVFGRFMAYAGVTDGAIDLLSHSGLPPYFVMWAIFIFYGIGGCFMEGMALTTLTIPILYPIVAYLGFNPIWFGVIIVLTGEMGLITPPVGMNVFVIKAVAPEVPLYTIYKGAAPFLIAEFMLFLILMHVPQITLFLPNIMLGK